MCLFSKCSSLWNKIKNFYAWKIKLNRNSLWEAFQLFMESIQGWLISSFLGSLFSRLLCFFCCVNAFSGTCLSLSFSHSGITWRCLSLMLEHYTAALGNIRPCKCHLPIEFKMSSAFMEAGLSEVNMSEVLGKSVEDSEAAGQTHIILT